MKDDISLNICQIKTLNFSLLTKLENVCQEIQNLHQNEKNPSSRLQICMGLKYV